MLRFAPSPTGDMHIGDMRVVLINYIVSRQRSEQFVVRIEDTDKERNLEGKDREILDILKKFAVEQDQLFYQSDNLGRHQQFAVSLIENSKAFACVCTADELETDRYSGKCANNTDETNKRIKEENIPFVIRIKKPIEDISFVDIIKGEITTNPNDVDSFVILGTDSIPTDNFAVACDDMLSDISIVIREEDHIGNTAKQIHIKNSLGYTKESEFAHLPMILDKDGAISIKWMLEQGFLLDTVINYLLSVGNETPTEIFNLPEAIEWFDLSVLSKSPAKFDIDKLRLLNRKQLGMIEDKKLSTLFGFADADIGKLLKLYLVETSTINELDVKIKAVFQTKEVDAEWKEEMEIIAEIIRNAPMLDTFDDFRQHIISESGLEGERLLKPLSILMTGTQNGPELRDIYPLIKPFITEIARITS